MAGLLKFFSRGGAGARTNERRRRDKQSSEPQFQNAADSQYSSHPAYLSENGTDIQSVQYQNRSVGDSSTAGSYYEDDGAAYGRHQVVPPGNFTVPRPYDSMAAANFNTPLPNGNMAPPGGFNAPMPYDNMPAGRHSFNSSMPITDGNMTPSRSNSYHMAPQADYNASMPADGSRPLPPGPPPGPRIYSPSPIQPHQGPILVDAIAANGMAAMTPAPSINSVAMSPPPMMYPPPMVPHPHMTARGPMSPPPHTMSPPASPAPASLTASNQGLRLPPAPDPAGLDIHVRTQRRRRRRPPCPA